MLKDPRGGDEKEDSRLYSLCLKTGWAVGVVYKSEVIAVLF